MLSWAAELDHIAQFARNNANMTAEKWEQIKENIKSTFSIEDEGVEDVLVETGEGPVKQGTAEYIIFDSPMGRLKLRLEKKPKLEDKKYFYSHRAGDSARVEYKFSADETVLTFKAYKYSDADDDWKEIDAERINF